MRTLGTGRGGFLLPVLSNSALSLLPKGLSKDLTVIFL